MSSVPFENIPANLQRHPVPVLHLGRMAKDLSVRGQRNGRALLFHVLRLARDVADLVGIYTVEVVALDDAAQGFYEKYGFVAVPAAPGGRTRLYLPLKLIRRLDLK